MLKQNRSQNEESKVSTHPNRMASRRKKDQDESEEGGDATIRNVIGKGDHKVAYPSETDGTYA